MSLFSAPGALPRMAMVGNHTPRQCGIATFTADLRAALSSRFPQLDCRVLAMNDPRKDYAYPECVRAAIAQEDLPAYGKAAQWLNGQDLDVLSLQHEYGIFGGRAGSHVLGLLRELRLPVVTTLHTILPEPDPCQWTVMDEIIRRSERLVVMSAHGAALLQEVHGVAARRIDLIPHGIPAVPFHGRHKDRIGLEGRQVLLTFGLLAPDKSIEFVIEAMPGILERFPETVYVVLGASHPHVRAQQGESYRRMLEDRARSLGVAGRVIFHNRFVSQDELTAYLAAADIYITPYLKLEQITSGTLAYALGPPPIETARGWLMLYHGVRQTVSGCIYRVGLALLDLEDPGRCLLRGDAWVFGPETEYEMRGDVGQVTFPCGATLEDDGDTLNLYYGAADTTVALATASLRRLLEWLDEHGQVD